jgi:predicted amidohydrolase
MKEIPMASMTAAVVQLDAQEDPQVNRERAVALIAKAAARGAQLVVLPEMFVFFSTMDQMVLHAEAIPGSTSEMLQAAARRHQIYLVGGSFCEKIPGNDKVYNTNLVINPDGEIIAQYRKIHLFEIDAPGEVVFNEAEAIEFGKDVVAAETPFGVIGLTICYDLRFPELYRALADKDARIITLPAAFALKTGKDHWETLIRARAIENQVYMLASAQVGIKPNGYMSYGRSMIVDPWGTVIAQAQDTEAVITAELDMDYLEKVRKELPALKNQKLR